MQECSPKMSRKNKQKECMCLSVHNNNTFIYINND